MPSVKVRRSCPCNRQSDDVWESSHTLTRAIPLRHTTLMLDHGTRTSTSMSCPRRVAGTLPIYWRPQQALGMRTRRNPPRAATSQSGRQPQAARASPWPSCEKHSMALLRTVQRMAAEDSDVMRASFAWDARCGKQLHCTAPRNAASLAAAKQEQELRAAPFERKTLPYVALSVPY